MAPAKRSHFDVAISYAHGDSKQAGTIATPFKHQPVNPFDDTYEHAPFWEKERSLCIAETYHDKTHYGIIFCSKQHAAQLQTAYALGIAQIGTQQENQTRIFPGPLDDTETPSLLLPIVSLRQPSENAATIITTVMRQMDRTIYKLPSQMALAPDVPATTSQSERSPMTQSRHGKAGKDQEDIILEGSKNSQKNRS